MFGLTSIHLYAYIGVALLIGYLVWREHSLTRKLAVAKHETAAITSTLKAERAARAHELKIAKEASDDYQNRLQRLETARVDTPVRTVRLCKSAPNVPAAANGTDAGTAGEQPPEAGPDIEVSRDIGPDLYALATEADERAAQCNALIKWVRSR